MLGNHWLDLSFHAMLDNHWLEFISSCNAEQLLASDFVNSWKTVQLLFLIHWPLNSNHSLEITGHERHYLLFCKLVVAIVFPL